jgi:hypothetical protein
MSIISIEHKRTLLSGEKSACVVPGERVWDPCYDSTCTHTSAHARLKCPITTKAALQCAPGLVWRRCPALPVSTTVKWSSLTEANTNPDRGGDNLWQLLKDRLAGLPRRSDNRACQTQPAAQWHEMNAASVQSRHMWATMGQYRHVSSIFKCARHPSPPPPLSSSWPSSSPCTRASKAGWGLPSDVPAGEVVICYGDGQFLSSNVGNALAPNKRILHAMQQ